MSGTWVGRDLGEVTMLQTTQDQNEQCALERFSASVDSGDRFRVIAIPAAILLANDRAWQCSMA